jgi:hypothetical protein
VSALDDEVVAVVGAAPDGARFAEVLIRMPDHVLPVEVFETLQRLTRAGRLAASGVGTSERPMVPRYRVRRSA